MLYAFQAYKRLYRTLYRRQLETNLVVWSLLGPSFKPRQLACTQQRRGIVDFQLYYGTL